MGSRDFCGFRVKVWAPWAMTPNVVPFILGDHVFNIPQLIDWPEPLRLYPRGTILLRSCGNIGGGGGGGGGGGSEIRGTIIFWEVFGGLYWGSLIFVTPHMRAIFGVYLGVPLGVQP